MAKSLVADENRVNELVQHVLTEALKNPPRNPKPWITVVMRAAAWRMIRSESRRKHREKAVARDEMLPVSSPRSDQSETRERLARFVHELEEPYRETLILHFFEDLSLEEIAKRKGIPSATVRTRLRRGLTQMREKLRAHYGDPSRWVFALVPVSGLRKLSDVQTEAEATRWKSCETMSRTRFSKGLFGAAAIVLVGATAVLLAVPSNPQAESLDRTAQAPIGFGAERFARESEDAVKTEARLSGAPVSASSKMPGTASLPQEENESVQDSTSETESRSDSDVFAIPAGVGKGGAGKQGGRAGSRLVGQGNPEPSGFSSTLKPMSGNPHGSQTPPGKKGKTKS